VRADPLGFAFTSVATTAGSRLTTTHWVLIVAASGEGRGARRIQNQTAATVERGVLPTSGRRSQAADRIRVASLLRR
jgi:hypothetical protein